MKTAIVSLLTFAMLCLCADAQSTSSLRQSGGLLNRPGGGRMLRPAGRLLNRPGFRPAVNLLEPIIPIDEAMNLVKEGKGKGFYQLAIRYAQGNELPKDEKAAYKLLCRACDLNYANAVLVEGLYDEGNLRESNTSNSTSPSTYIYCGAYFSGGNREYALLTNKVAFARVMTKYEKARDLGALAATNQIAALNKRLADFYRREAEQARLRDKANTAEENNRRVAALLGEDVRQIVAQECTNTCRTAEEEERKEQRRALLQIQEELRRQREERAVQTGM